MKERQRILIAEDHTLIREGLRALLTSASEFEVIGEAEDGRQAVQLVEELAPDIVLMDLTMPRMNGMEAIAEIKRRCPETKILVLTVHKTEEHILAVLKAGAEGYVLKDDSHSALVAAIKSIVEGKTYLSPGVAERVIEGYLEGQKKIREKTSWDTLTQREREVLKLIAEGYKNQDIAEFLCISSKTVEKHRANLMKKLDLHSVSALTSFAIDKGLISD